mgnify:CR=1 FL=1
MGEVLSIFYSNTQKNWQLNFKITFDELCWLESRKTLQIQTIPIYNQNERKKLNEIEGENEILQKFWHEISF